MRKFRHTVYAGELEVVATLSGRAMDALRTEQRMQADLTRALEEALRLGVPVDALSAETGLTPDAIRARVRGRVAAAGSIG
jgi:hypothetical protein